VGWLVSNFEEVLRTISYGESALGRLRRDQVAAYPRHYELWYTYAGGFNLPLNGAIDQIIESRGRLSAEEVLALYNTFLSPNRLDERVEEVGGQVVSEISELSQLIAAALAAGKQYGQTLDAASVELRQVADGSSLKEIVSRLTAATSAATAQNRELEGELANSRAELGQLRTNLESIRYESLIDPLTGLANRKHFDKSIERAMANAGVSNTSLALLMIDIDHFKRFNDQYGHQTGDQVLRLVAMAIKHAIKATDIACRYGGEEFGVILPETSFLSAQAVAERIRNTVRAREVVKRSTGQTLGRITVSIGVAAFQVADRKQSLIERADSRLYAAKRAGRDRVVAADTRHRTNERVA
jgi:diguanylate cyclase